MKGIHTNYINGELVPLEMESVGPENVTIGYASATRNISHSAFTQRIKPLQLELGLGYNFLMVNIMLIKPPKSAVRKIFDNCLTCAHAYRVISCPLTLLLIPVN